VPRGAVTPRATLRLGSWNIKHLSLKKLRGGGKHATPHTLPLLAKHLATFDVCAIQEVLGHRDGDAIMRALCAAMGAVKPRAQWRYALSPPLTGRGSNNENYAFVYDARVATLRSAALLDQGALARSASAAATFGRPPFLAAFTAGALDFVAATLHAQSSDRGRQAAEIRLLRDVVLAARAATSTENVIVLGDFNLPPETERASSPWRPLVALDYVPLIHALYKTMASDSQTYDNIWIPSHMKACTAGQGVVDFVDCDREYFAGRDRLSIAGEVSDHLALWGEFYTDRPVRSGAAGAAAAAAEGGGGEERGASSEARRKLFTRPNACAAIAI
jgi:endonuclease/exonuclease/phosphatase family metal-dependent hydrolase